MRKFFWLNDVCVRLSAIKVVSKVKSAGTGGSFTVSDIIGYDDNALSVYYPTLAEAVAVHSALTEAMENECES